MIVKTSPIIETETEIETITESITESITETIASNPQSLSPGTNKPLIKAKRPAIWRRILASIIDRLVPMPFLVFLFPKWVLVVLLYHLFCDSTPERKSLGKWVCRLRVVSSTSTSQCSWWQPALRRIFIALTQAAWCFWESIPFVFAYEITSLAYVLLNPDGRRIEDYLTNTRVITEKTFRQFYK
jgi:uncharacterized RDD family membrane protein YckC